MILPRSLVLSLPTQGLLRRILLPRAWMVMTSPGKPPPNSESTDARRSATVLLVSEMSRMPLGSTPESTRCLTFPTSVVVLPVPAAAITSWVSASSVTAASCCGSRGCPLTTMTGPAPTMGPTSGHQSRLLRSDAGITVERTDRMDMGSGMLVHPGPGVTDLS